MDSTWAHALPTATAATTTTPPPPFPPRHGMDYQGSVYNLHGDLILEKPVNLDQWLTDEVYPMRCPHPSSACKMASVVRRQVKSEQDSDSIGGTVTCMCCRVPAALAEPVCDRLEAKLAHAMLSLPATKGFEIGSGFAGTSMKGSQHNDRFIKSNSTEAGAPALTTATMASALVRKTFFHVATATYDGTETVKPKVFIFVV